MKTTAKEDLTALKKKAFSVREELFHLQNTLEDLDNKIEKLERVDNPGVVKQLSINNCQDCYFCVKEPTHGAGFAHDYMCTAGAEQKCIAGYVEWDSEKPKNHEFPDFCPLPSVILDQNQKP